MAQVKKLQGGGNNAYTGKFKKNGRELVGQAALDELARVYTSAPMEERAGFDIASRAIQNGDIIEYHPDNSISIVDAAGNDVLSKYTDIRTSPSDSNARKNWDATWNNKRHRFNKSLAPLAMINMGAEWEQPAASGTKGLSRGSGWFDYETNNETGAKRYKNTAQNEGKIGIIEAIADYLGLSEEAAKKKYTNGQWTSADLTSLRSWYNNLANRSEYFTGLKDRIRSGQTLTSEDIDNLKFMGFDPDSVDGDGNGGLSIASDWKGNRDLARQLGIGIEKRKDGHYYITGDSDYAKQNWYTGGLDWLRGTGFYDGGFIHNGRLYTAQEAYDDKTGIFNPWYAAYADENSDWRQRYDIWNKSGFRFLNDRNGRGNDYYGQFQRFDLDSNYTPIWYQHFVGLGNQYYDVNGLTNAYDNTNGKQIISYIDPTAFDPITGMFKPKYVVYNPTDNSYNSYDDEALMLNEQGFTPKTRGKITNLDFRNWERMGKGQYATFIEFGRPGQRNTIVVDREGKFHLARKNPNGEFIDPEAITNIAAVYDIVKNPKKYQDYRNQDLRNLLFTAIATSTGGANEPVKKGRIVRSGGGYDIDENGHVWRGNVLIRKQGGSINKFQFGGAVDIGTTNIKQTSTADAQTDITKAHALDSTDGGLTNVEWAQIGAAIWDLAGVGLSFIPVAGGIAGAAVGAGASTTRFIADVKQDGFQGKDLKNYGVNLILDAASILPIVGTGAKAAKAAKVIKSVGRPLIKALSIAGASAPVITAVQRIANGEKYTSADLAQAIQGLGSGIIAAKSIKDAIGNAKLAQKVAGKAADNANAALNNVKKIKVGSMEKELTTDEIEQFIANNPTKAKAIEAVKKFAPDPTQVKRTEAVEFLEKMGVEFKEGKSKFDIKAWKKGFRTKGDTQAIFNKPKEQQASSWLHYYLNPFTRSKVLGSQAVFGVGRNPGQMSSLNRNDFKGTFRRVNKGTGTLADKALLRMTAENPQAFGYLFTNGSRQNIWGQRVPQYTSSIFDRVSVFGGRRYYRTNLPKMRYLAPVSTTAEASLHLPTFKEYSMNPEVARYFDSMFPAIPIGRTQSPYMVDIPLSTARTYGNGQSALEFLAFKKGGKILKGKTDLKVPSKKDLKTGYDESIEGIDLGKLAKDSENIRKTIYSQAGLSDLIDNIPENIVTKNQTTGKYEYTSDVQQKAAVAANTYADKSLKRDEARFDDSIQSGAYKKASKMNLNPEDPNRTGSDPGTPFRLGVNWANVDDLMRGFTEAQGIYRDRDLKRDALQKLKMRQFYTPHMDPIRMDTSDIEQSYENQANPLLEAQYATSDSRDAAAFELSRASKLSDLESNKGTAITQRISDTKEKNRQIEYSNKQAASKTANDKSAYLTQLEYQDSMLDSEALNRLFAQVINPLGQQFSQQGRTAYEKNLEKNAEAELATERERASAAYLSEMAPLRNEYESTADKTIYRDFDSWVQSDSKRLETYQRAREREAKILADKQRDIAKKLARAAGSTLMYAKKGGSIRSAQEQIAINSSKNAQRSVDKLSDNLMKMLQQLLRK